MIDNVLDVKDSVAISFAKLNLVFVASGVIIMCEMCSWGNI